MAAHIVRRFASAAATVLFASFVCFLLLRVLPGDPARIVLGPLASQESLDLLRQEMGSDRPIWEQFWIFVRDFFSGDWGYSYAVGVPVRELIVSRVAATVELGLFAFVLALVPALLLALATTYRPRRTFDRAARGLSFIAIGTPSFWLALTALILFSQWLPVFPGPEGRLSPELTPPESITGFYIVDSLVTGQFAVAGDAVWHLLLPGLVLAFAPFAFIYRLLRTNLLEVRNEPYLVVVRSKGISRWTAFARHALPNAILPTLTASALVLAELVAGSVLVETIFVWPGLGALVVNSIQRQDYAVVQAFILLTAVVYVVINAIVDVLYGTLDPRVRLRPRVAA